MAAFKFVSYLALSLLSIPSAFAQQRTFHYDKGSLSWVTDGLLQCELKNHNVVIAAANDHFMYFGHEKLKPDQRIALHNGTSNCGMGKCYYKFTNGNYSYEVLLDRRQAYRPPAPMSSGEVTVKKGSQVLLKETCRNPLDAAVMCHTKNRTVYVTRNPQSGVWGYKSFDHTNKTAQPSLSLSGGELIQEPGQISFGHRNGSYVYEVRVALPEPGLEPEASVFVFKNGHQISQEHCSTFTLGDVKLGDGDGDGPMPIPL